MISHKLWPEHGLAWIKLAGKVEGVRMIAVAEKVQDEASWRPSFDVVWDCRHTTELGISPTEMATFIDLRISTDSGLDVCIARDFTHYTIAKLFSVVSRVRGKDAVVVETVGEALETVGLATPPWRNDDVEE